MDYVYVVIGWTGEYSDYTQWEVAAYTDKDAAEAHAGAAGRAVAGSGQMEYEEQEALTNPYDPNMKMYYTGTEYRVVAVPLFRHPDEYLEHAHELKG